MGTVLNLTLLDCPGVSFIAELVSELLRAAIFCPLQRVFEC